MNTADPEYTADWNEYLRQVDLFIREEWIPSLKTNMKPEVINEEEEWEQPFNGASYEHYLTVLVSFFQNNEAKQNQRWKTVKKTTLTWPSGPGQFPANLTADSITSR